MDLLQFILLLSLLRTCCHVAAMPEQGTHTAAMIPPLIRNPDAFVRVPIDSLYTFVVSANYDNKFGQLLVTSETYGDYGYLSAWPLLPFYGTMCAVYTLSLIAWFVLCCCFHKDLLQIHYLIGVVIFIGFVEQTDLYGVYQTLNNNRKTLPGSLMFGELVSATRSALTRVLFVIISVGFGIVRPRLGPTFPVVVAVGISFFTLRCVAGFWRATTPKANEQATGLVIMFILLFVVDAFVCCWVFASLILTMRRLHIRQNDRKLSLYCHFTNALIFSFLVSLRFVIWSVSQHKCVECLTDWKHLWVDEAYWHLQFYVILLVIMILFRPSANQRYGQSVTRIGHDLGNVCAAMCNCSSAAADDEDGEAIKSLLEESFDEQSKADTVDDREQLLLYQQLDPSDLRELLCDFSNSSRVRGLID